MTTAMHKRAQADTAPADRLYPSHCLAIYRWNVSLHCSVVDNEWLQRSKTPLAKIFWMRLDKFASRSHMRAARIPSSTPVMPSPMSARLKGTTLLFNSGLAPLIPRTPVPALPAPRRTGWDTALLQATRCASTEVGACALSPRARKDA